MDSGWNARVRQVHIRVGYDDEHDNMVDAMLAKYMQKNLQEQG